MKRLLTRRFSMIEVATILAVVIVGAGAYVWATTVPYTFQPHTRAKSSEVNANFAALAGAIDSISVGTPTCAGNNANDVMVKVGTLCVDKYEASVWENSDGTGAEYGTAGDDYPTEFKDNGNWTTPAYAVSMAGATPSTYITWFQAQQACALSGKRLMTNAEWQLAAAGTPDPNGSDDHATTCVVDDSIQASTGSRSACVSKWGVNDMVGNLAEWVADWNQGDTNGWDPVSGLTNSKYGSDDMIGVNPATDTGDGQNFPAALIRGGSYGSLGGAGVFTLLAFVAPAESPGDVGFRCVR